MTAFSKKWLWALLALALLPFLVLVAVTPLLGSRRLERVGGEMRSHIGEMNAHMVDSVQGLKTITAYNHGSARSVEVDQQGDKLGLLDRKSVV